MADHKVYIKFPKTGLGNMMLVWAHGLVFANQHRLPMFAGSWWGFRWGAWIRRESRKRLYWGYFREDSLLKKLMLRWALLTSRTVVEPEQYNPSLPATLFVFKNYQTEGDYFKKLKDHRGLVRDELYKLLTPALRNKLNTYDTPVIGIHIRRGDFKLGSTLTPATFFRDAILAIRKEAGEILPVTVFTDAAAEEIPEVLSLPGVRLAEPKADVLDILLLSKSRILIMSISSTFSLWAGFLSDGIVLKHPQEWHPDVRPLNINRDHYEGKFDPSTDMDPELKQQLHKLMNGTGTPGKYAVA